MWPNGLRQVGQQVSFLDQMWMHAKQNTWFWDSRSSSSSISDTTCARGRKNSENYQISVRKMKL